MVVVVEESSVDLGRPKVWIGRTKFLGGPTVSKVVRDDLRDANAWVVSQSRRLSFLLVDVGIHGHEPPTHFYFSMDTSAGPVKRNAVKPACKIDPSSSTIATAAGPDARLRTCSLGGRHE